MAALEKIIDVIIDVIKINSKNKIFYIQLFPFTAILTAFLFFYYLQSTSLFNQFKEMLEKPEAIYSLALFVVVCILMIMFVFSTYFEQRWAKENWEEIIPSPEVLSLFVSAIYGGIFALLIFLTPNIKQFAITYFLYSVFDLFANSFYLVIIRAALKKADRPEDDAGLIKYESTINFYEKHPWFKIGLLKTLLALFASFFALKNSNPVYAFILIVFAISLNELIIWSWRHRLYRDYDFFKKNASSN